MTQPIDFYQKLRSIGLTHDACSEVSDLFQPLIDFAQMCADDIDDRISPGLKKIANLLINEPSIRKVLIPKSNIWKMSYNPERFGYDIHTKTGTVGFHHSTEVQFDDDDCITIEVID